MARLATLGASVGLYREHCAEAPRARRGALRYSDAEFAVICAAAAGEGMRPGAWVQQVAFREALARGTAPGVDVSSVTVLVEELRQHRRVLTNIGGNLNDLARAANSTGAMENVAAVQVVLRLVRNTVAGSDELVRRLRTELLGR